MSETCKQCGRPVQAEQPSSGRYHGRVVTATVQYEFYGCDTGCDGHRVYGFDEHGNEVCQSEFGFSAWPADGESDEQFARRFVGETFGPRVSLNWEDSNVSQG